MAEEDDNKMAERWQKEADGVLIFTGLFSATVATLGAVSIQDLRPNSQDISALYLGNIYQLLAEPDISGASNAPNAAKLPAFSPPSYAIWVNALWFLSLTMALCCAIMAMLLQRWGRRYIWVTQPSRCNPEKRARIRALFAGSTDKLFIKVVCASLPCLLHLAVFLFFIGLLIFLFRVNHIVFGLVLFWIGLCVLNYIFIAVISAFQLDSLPYSTIFAVPGTLLACVAYFGLTIFGDRFGLRTWKRYGNIIEHDFERLFGESFKLDERTISKLSSKVDVRVLEWTIDALGEDSALEKFFNAIPGFFFNSKLRDLPERIKRKFKRALVGFLDRTFSSDIVSESTKNIRVVTCLNAAHATHDSLTVLRLFQGILNGRWREALRSVKIGQSLRRWSFGDDQEIALHARSIVARIIVNVREYDASAIALAVDQLGLSEHILRDHLAHGNSVLLANLIYITNQISHTGSTCFDLLESLSKFDIQGTLPGLRRDFCALWNQIVMEAQDDGSQIAALILKSLRHVYIALHQGTEALPTAFSSSTDARDRILDQPSSYPSCHCLDPPPHRLSNESKEATQAHGSSHTSPPPDPVSTTVTPSTVPGIPVHTTDRCPPGEVPDALQCIALAATLSRPLESNKHPGMDAPLAAPNISETSSIASAVPQSILRYATLHGNDSEVVLPTTSTCPTSPTVQTPAFRDSVIPAGLPSVEFAPTQPDHISYSLRTPTSSPTTAHSHDVLQVISVPDTHVTTRIGSLVAHDGTHDLNPPIPIRSTLAAPDIVEAILQPEDCQCGLSESQS